MKKLISLFLALAACLSLFALSASAEGPDASYEYVPAELPADSLTWDFDAGSGTLSIRGSGPMRSYLEADAEWAVHRDQIRSVILEDGISSVGSCAFYDFPNLTEVLLPDSIVEIGTAAFYYDWALRKITIPSSLKYVGRYAFYNTLLWEPVDLVFPEGCEYIGDQAFHSALKSGGIVSLPSTLRYLGEQAFTNAYLSDFTVAEGNPVYRSENHAVYTADMKRILMLAPITGGLGEFRIPEGVESISAECFNVMQGIETVYIPASVNDIAEGAFFSTFDLRQIIVDEANPSYRSLDGLLLSKDGSLLLAWPDGKSGNELIIPDGVERLGEYLFYGRFDEGCTVVLPESVREIGKMSLPGSMASLSLPAGLERIDDNVFYYSISIGTILYGGTAEQWQAVSIGDGNTALSSVPLRTS